MKTQTYPIQSFTFVTSLLLMFASLQPGFCQSDFNSGKPVVTFNTTGPIAVKTQAIPAFPGGDDKLSDFVIDQADIAEGATKLPRKLWLTASIDPMGKVIKLIPTYDSDPTLKREMERVGRLMPRWTPGKINEKGVETSYQFLIRQ